MNLLQWIEHATERSMAIDCLYLEGSVFLFFYHFPKESKEFDPQEFERVWYRRRFFLSGKSICSQDYHVLHTTLRDSDWLMDCSLNDTCVSF